MTLEEKFMFDLEGPLHAGTMKSKMELFPFFYTYRDGIRRKGPMSLCHDTQRRRR